MDSSQQQSPVTITLPLRDFLDYLLGSKEFSVIGLELAAQLSNLDPTESLCHVEYLYQNTTTTVWGTKRDVARVWHSATWRTTAARAEQQKQESEIRIQEWEKRKAILTRIESGLVAKLGAGMEDTISNLALKLYNERNVAAIELLAGIKLTREEFS